LYSTAIGQHNQSSRIANGHNSIGISSGKRSVDREAIPDHRSLVSANQPFRGDRVLLDKPGEEIAYLPVSPYVWFSDPDSNVRASVSLGNYPPVSAGRVSRIHVHLGIILLAVEFVHQLLYVIGECIGTGIGPFRKIGFLRVLTRITGSG